MPNDTLYVSSNAEAVLMFEHGLIPFDVYYCIEGRVRVYATDAESAKALVDERDPLGYVDFSALVTDDAKAVSQ